ncbi:MAG: dihydrolipoyl dehydrogenase [Alphaproteobacteria bacterium]|nr:dihydrolipoyl dehydrogenase [Alphaproteobacteria bacterium]
MSQYDLVVIGGGPGGYVAAIKAAQLGMKVACVEKRGALGGTCLNVGCIPSKALLNISHKYHDAKHFNDLGIKIKGLDLDLSTVMSNKDNVVKGLTQGIEGLFKKNQVTYIQGTGNIKSPTEVVVSAGKGKSETIQTKRILIATGSEVSSLPGVEIDEKRIVSSTGALTLSEVPKKLVVIGAGVIGLEMGSVWSRFGSEVQVIEYSQEILPFMDKDVRKAFQRTLEKQGFSFKLGAKVSAAKVSGKTVTLTVESLATGESENIKADVVLVAVGRRPYTDGLGLEEVGVIKDNRGRVLVDDHFETNVKGIFAIGDVIPGPMLAHKAEEDGIAAVETMAGQAGHVDYDLVPSVIYTHPEVASVGKTEDQLKELGIAVNIGKFSFMANSRARANQDTEGFVKIIACKETDMVLGVHIVGPQAGELIQEAVTAMAFKAASEDIARICHAHPCLSEAVKEAALATFSKPIHS